MKNASYVTSIKYHIQHFLAVGAFYHLNIFNYLFVNSVYMLEKETIPSRHIITKMVCSKEELFGMIIKNDSYTISSHC